MDVDGALSGGGVIAPHPTQQLVPGEDPGGRRHQVGQEIELRCGECDLGVGGEDLALVGQAPHRAADQRRTDRVERPRGAPEHAGDPGDDLAGREGLGDVVVRPELESDDSVDLVVAGGDEEDRRPVALATQDPAHGDAVNPGEADVEEHDRRLPGPHRAQGRQPVPFDERPVARHLELQGDHRGNRRVVLDDQHELTRLRRHRRTLLSPRMTIRSPWCSGRVRAQRRRGELPGRASARRPTR